MNDMYPLYAARSEEHRDAASILTRILSSGTSGTFTSLRISIGWSNYDYLISERVTRFRGRRLLTPTIVAARIVVGIAILENCKYTVYPEINSIWTRDVPEFFSFSFFSKTIEIKKSTGADY